MIMPELGEKLFCGSSTVDPHLHGMMERQGLFFGKPQPGAKGHGDLFLHQIDAVPAFRDAVLHLEPGVDFNQIWRAIGIHQKLHSGQGIVP